MIKHWVFGENSTFKLLLIYSILSKFIKKIYQHLLQKCINCVTELPTTSFSGSQILLERQNSYVIPKKYSSSFEISFMTNIFVPIVIRKKTIVETRACSGCLYCNVSFREILEKEKKIGGRLGGHLKNVLFITISYSYCLLSFKIFNSLCLDQIVQFLDVQHSDNIRLPY